MKHLLCKFRPHKWTPVKAKTVDFGMRALKILQKVRCSRCGETKKRAGFTSPIGVIWKSEGGGPEWEDIDERDWVEEERMVR